LGIVEEAGECCPSLRSIDDAPFDWLRTCVSGACRPQFIRWCPAHFGFDGIECGDPFEDVGGERGWPRLVDIEYLAPEMPLRSLSNDATHPRNLRLLRPAGDFGDTPALVELVISGIGIGLEMAGEAGELGLRNLPW
jgi:hypothetical protein